MSTVLTVGVVVVFAILVKLTMFPGESRHAEGTFVTSLTPAYDYIIVGGGTAGSVLANRLSADKGIRVLVIEAGGDDRGVPEISVPAFGLRSLKSKHDWQFYTESHPDGLKGLKDERMYWPRGKVLGGSSSLSAMQYSRGSRNDFDRWASYVGDIGWDYIHVLPYFLRSEGVLMPGLANSAYHNRSGPLKVSSPEVRPIMMKIMEAAKELGVRETKDYNGKNMEGISHSQVTTDHGERVSASRAFLHPAMHRENLHVTVHTHVTRVLLEKNRAVGVEVIREGRKSTVRARREVILSAGVVGSPHILMLSGIGPKKHLDQFHIPVVANLPVGENLQDHVTIDLAANVPRSLSATQDDLKTLWSKVRHQLLGTGPLSVPWVGVEGTMFLTVDKESKKQYWPDLQLVFNTATPSVSHLHLANYKSELIKEMTPGRSRSPPHGFMCHPMGLRPLSRGRVTLHSRDPFDHPRITTNYLDHREDVDLLIKGIEICRSLVDTRVMKGVGATHSEPRTLGPCKGLDFGSRDHWECEVMNRSQPMHHGVGTCKMGAVGDETAVVDPQLKVQGVLGLRVVDASVMPWLPSGGPLAATIMVAERAADLIRKKLPPRPLKVP